MTDAEFALEIEKILNHIAETVEMHDPEGEIDIDLNGDILNLTTGFGVFVINKQSAVKEIWLSSPVSGPYHFTLKDEVWRSKAGDEFYEILSRDLKIKFEK
jgi:CyaY protein